MFKRLDPRDINITPFKAYKEFTVTNTDSGSGVYGFRAISSSAHNFNSDTAPKTTFDSASFYPTDYQLHYFLFHIQLHYWLTLVELQKFSGVIKLFLDSSQ